MDARIEPTLELTIVEGIEVSGFQPEAFRRSSRS